MAKMHSKADYFTAFVHLGRAEYVRRALEHGPYGWLDHLVYCHCLERAVRDGQVEIAK